MEGGSEVEHFEKSFVSCKIEWKIVNFCLAIRSDSNCIRSPDFNIGVTKWCMVLDINSSETEDGCISLSLERLPDDAPDVVSVDWDITLETGVKTSSPIAKCCSYNRNSIEGLKLGTITDVLAKLVPFEPDTLKIVCYYFIRMRGGSAQPDEPVNVDPGLRSLSDDFMNLFNRQDHTDATIKVGGKEIKAHKIILCRNKVFGEYILNSDFAWHIEIELENLNHEAVYKLVSFLYSGDVKIILDNQSISMHKCLEYFQCDDLLCYYAPGQFDIRTEFEVKQYSFKWHVSDFDDKVEDCIKSPLLKGSEESITWQLHLYRPEDENGFFTILAEIVEGNKPQYLCLHFALADLYGLLYFKNRLLRYDRCYSELRLKEFFKRSLLDKDCLLDDGTLRINFEVRTSEGNQKSIKGTRLAYFMQDPKDSLYRKLSSQMLLMRGGMYVDITLKSGDEKFTVHKCILSARCSTISTKLLQEPSAGIILMDLKPNALDLFIEYIYGGALEEAEFDDLLELYEASTKYPVSNMKEECAKRLLEKITYQNVGAVSRAAMAMGDETFFATVESMKFD